MKRDNYNSAILEENQKPNINNDAFELKSEDLFVERKYIFHTQNERISIFKELDEPYIHVFLKALSYHIYKKLYNTLKVDPAIYRKYKSDLMALSYAGEPVCWIECFERDYEKIEYICKHISVEEFILVEVADDIKPFIEEIKKKVHYKYHHLITVINFIPEIIYYVDPDDMFILEDWYQIIDVE
ncbi:MAG: hypothetical protein H7263_12505 [Candidatus Sericytochromatia bacterium]|nr:hypothetical protein [Candidatus Sericytochromatia bacterium]